MAPSPEDSPPEGHSRPTYRFKSEPSPPNPNAYYDNAHTNSVDNQLKSIAEDTDSQLIDFSDPDQCFKLERRFLTRSLNRFVVKGAPLTFGLWRDWDDIDVYFFTHDNENRWAEVIAEGLWIKVGSKDLKEATKDGTLDLTDDRLSRRHDGRRTQWAVLKLAYVPTARIVLHYCRISPEWLGSTDIMRNLAYMSEALPQWPANEPEKSYTKNAQNMIYQQQLCVDKANGSQDVDHIRTVYPFVRAWAELHDLWKPELLGARILFDTISTPEMLAGFNRECEDEEHLLTVLKAFASEQFHASVPQHCRLALTAAAKESLKDPEKTLEAVCAVDPSLISFPLHDPYASRRDLPLKPKPYATTEQRFRSARSAISRLRFDPKHAETEYDVGYEDRFEGIMWIALAKWGGKGTEEEDFIPEHRVKKIVRARDGVVVWDREERVDRTGEV